tara:strand:+ start:743 stop:1063 length:321 start_codon:yes stop_codon:yes gene_type:complete
MWIDVTEEHIKAGIPEDECNCPIALAVQDAVEQSFCDSYEVDRANVIVTVHDDDINVHHHNNNAEMEHMFGVSPKSKCEWKIVKDFIHKFDSGKDVEPFMMEMETN